MEDLADELEDLRPAIGRPRPYADEPDATPAERPAVGTGRVEHTIPMAFSADAPASSLDVGTDGHDHLITPEERSDLAMAGQQRSTSSDSSGHRAA